MARGLSDKQKTILKIVNDIYLSSENGIYVRTLYWEIKNKLYPDFRIHYRYESNIKHTKIRYWMHGEIIDNNEIYAYRRHLAVLRSSISRAVKELINRGLLIKTDKYFPRIKITDSGKKQLTVNVCTSDVNI